MKFLISIISLLTFAVAAEPEYRFDPIFDGSTLKGWKGEGYVVEDGAIVCTPKGRNLMTEKLYSNYVLDFQFKLPPGGNNGIGVHYPGEGNPAYTGLEFQVLDNTAEKYKNLKEYQFHGSIYTMAPAKKGSLKAVGEWNHQRIYVNGPSVKVTLNGDDILEANLDELQKEFPKHAGVKRRSGHLAFCGHGDKVAYRSLQICELPPLANVEGVKAAGFTQLFDGKTLEGWKAEEGSAGHWVPTNGILKYDGRSEAKVKDLWTEKSYGDFVLVFDWRWGAPGPKMKRPIIDDNGADTDKMVEVQELDSGIYLRGSSKSQVNLWNWPVGSGEVYGYRTDKNQLPEVRAGVTPKVKADKPVGEWNRSMITMKGDLLTVRINGLIVIKDAQLPGVAAKGPIAFQHHGSAIDFANVWIKEL